MTTEGQVVGSTATPDVALESFRRDALVDSRGRTFRELHKQLTPRYAQIWTQIGLAYLAVASTVALALIGDTGTLGRRVLIAVAAAAVIGYTVAFIHLFFHEAAHYNVASERAANDLLANIFIGAIVGQEISRYRPIHFDHHRQLGMTDDPEHTYFDPLNVRFLIESLTGVRSFRVLTSRERALDAAPPRAAEQGADIRSGKTQLIAGAVFNAAVVIGLVLSGHFMTALAWIAGIVIVFPFVTAVRQLMEHRSEEASASTNYHEVAHGATNRLFGSGPLASTLGGAGFNRHLLHHWAPQISCTRLHELEAFLMDTPAAPALRKRQTTYSRTFVALFTR